MLISEQYALHHALRQFQEYNMLQEVACFGSCFEQMSETLLLVGIRRIQFTWLLESAQR